MAESFVQHMDATVVSAKFVQRVILIGRHPFEQKNHSHVIKYSVYLFFLWPYINRCARQTSHRDHDPMQNVWRRQIPPALK